MSTLNITTSIPSFEYGSYNVDGGVSYIASIAGQHGPILKMPQSGTEQRIFMVGPEANKFVLVSHRECFSHHQGWSPFRREILGPLPTRGLLTMDNPVHSQHRQVLNKGFGKTFVDIYHPTISEIVTKYVDSWKNDSIISPHDEMIKIVFEMISRSVLGIEDVALVDKLRELYLSILYSFQDFEHENNEDYEERVISYALELRELVAEIVRDRGYHNVDDPNNLLDIMLSESEGNAFSQEDIIDHVISFFGDGHQTTANLAARLLFFLSTNEAFTNRLQAEFDDYYPDNTYLAEPVRGLSLLEAAMLETGRLHSPVPFIPRGVIKSFDFQGYHVPVDSTVILAVGAGHRLASIFPNPDVFDPDRFLSPRNEDKAHPYALAIWGGGPRSCIGAGLAKLEVRAIATQVLRKFSLQPATDTTPERLLLVRRKT